MNKDHNVEWSSRTRSWGPFWLWTVTIYDGDRTLVKSGFAFSEVRAAVKLKNWLVEHGQNP